MTDDPLEQKPEDIEAQIADFDFVRECIRTYHLCGNDVEQRIKALSLLKSVQPQKAPVKATPNGTDNRSAVHAAQDSLRKR